MQINVAVQDANNIVCEVTPPQPEIIVIDRGVEGNGIVSIVPVTISTFQYLRITYTNGTVQDVGPLTSTAYTATAPITIVGNTISLATVPIASGGTDATTAAGAIQNLLPSYTGNANKRLGLNSLGTALEWVLDGGGTVTSVAMTVPTGLSISGSPITSSGTLALTMASGYAIPTTISQTNWDTAYSERQQWSGTATNLVASTGRTSLGATTLGSNLFTITNPSAITFPRFNADNTVSALDAATFRTAIGAGTSSTTGTVTSVSGTGTVSGISLSGTVTTSGSLTLGGALDLSAFNGAGAFTTLGASSTVTLSGGTANGVLYLNGSKVATSGSALSFDGTTFQNTGPINTSNNFVSKGTAIFFGDGADNSANVYATGGPVKFYANASEGMRLTSTGLGIGTSSPAYKLQVSGGATSLAANQYLRFGTIPYAAGDGGATNYIFSGPTSLTWRNAADNADLMYLSNSGNLGLGVTPSAWSSGRAFEVGGAGQGIWLSGGNDLYYNNNAYYNSGWKYGLSGNYATSYRQVNGQHIWSNAPSGTAGNAITFTQAMTLTSAGKLLVGWTTAPTASACLFADGVQSTNTSGGGGYANLALSGGGEAFYTHTGSAGSETYTERARIDSSGNLLIGTTSNIGISKVSVYSTNLATTANGISITNGANSTGGYFAAFYNYLGNVCGSISQSSASAVLYNVTSDQRLKENIQDADSASNLIDSLQVRKFDWKTDGNHQRYGFVAQELVTVAPEAVYQPANTDEMMAVDYSKLVPMLVKEIQSLRKRLADAGI